MAKREDVTEWKVPTPSRGGVAALHWSWLALFVPCAIGSAIVGVASLIHGERVGSGPELLGGVMCTTFAGVFAFLIARQIQVRRPIRLRRAKERITGIPGLKVPLPVGMGDVRVTETRKEVHMARGGTKIVFNYEIRFIFRREQVDESGEPETITTLFEVCPDPLIARSFALGLCRLGHYGLEWVGMAEDGPDVRAPDALDESLVSRLRRAPTGSREPPIPKTTWSSAWTESAPGEPVLELRSADILGRGIGFAGFIAAFALTLALVALQTAGWIAAVIVAVVGLSSTVIGARALATRWIEIRATPQGISERRRRIRGFSKRRGLFTDALQAIYLDPRALIGWDDGWYYLSLVGERHFQPIGRFESLEEARWVRSLLTYALLGEIPPSFAGESGPEPSAPESASEV